MIDKFIEGLRNMPAVQVIENGVLFIILVLGLVMFFRSESSFNKYFIPIICVIATILRIVHWAHYGNEPEFMTPLVTVVAGWLS